jgi:hypothetical protein
MKNTVLAVAMFAGIISALSVKAQNAPTPRPSDQAKLLQARLNLSDAQTSQITSILQSSPSNSNSMKDLDEPVPASASVQQQVANVLTASQQLAFQKMIATKAANTPSTSTSTIDKSKIKVAAPVNGVPPAFQNIVNYFNNKPPVATPVNAKTTSANVKVNNNTSTKTSIASVSTKAKKVQFFPDVTPPTSQTKN